ncbi:MAG: hypothetical protein HOY78_02330 [Saccharothrix sp.]|nr:hypothetical protein [Saccharothrix sp.]
MTSAQSDSGTPPQGFETKQVPGYVPAVVPMGGEVVTQGITPGFSNTPGTDPTQPKSDRAAADGGSVSGGDDQGDNASGGDEQGSSSSAKTTTTSRSGGKTGGAKS